MSRSVSIPLSRSSSPQMGMAPTSSSASRFAASRTESFSPTHCASWVITSRAVLAMASSFGCDSRSRTRALDAQPLPEWLRLQQDLESVVLFLLEDLVCARRLVQRQAVGGVVIDTERVVVVAHQGEEVVDPTPDVCLPHAESQLLVEDLEHRQRVDRAAVDA